MYKIYNNMLFLDEVAANLYKTIQHLNPIIDISKPIDSKDIMNIIKELSQRGYKFPEENTFFYNLNNKYVLYELKNEKQFNNDCKKYTFSTLGWNNNYTYLKNDTNGNFIYISTQN